MIAGMTSSQIAPRPATTDPDPEAPPAAEMIAAAALAWLTPGAFAVIGQQVAASITTYRGGQGRSRRGPRRWPGSTRPC
jgi:hypothetical protein